MRGKGRSPDEKLTTAQVAAVTDLSSQRRRFLVPGAIAVAAILLTSTLQSAEPPPAVSALTPRTEPIVPVPSVAVDPNRVALGERLFHDVRLSREDRRACATCHPLERGGMDGRPRPISADGALQLRNTPTIFNVGLSAFLNWDGIATSLEAHAEMVLLNPSLMNTTWPELLAKLRSDDYYVGRFKALYQDGLTPRSVLDALATFERSLHTPNSPFDRHLRGEPDALTAGERRGYQLFKSYGCITCHQGMNIGGNIFQRFGIFGGALDPDADQGRYQLTRIPRDRGVFRVPSLRNVAATAPYFHDGRARTLEDAVDTMARVQLGRTLAQDEVGLIARFLHTLTGEYRGRPVAAVAKPQ
jgi:cytochrome c peroxidase